MIRRIREVIYKIRFLRAFLVLLKNPYKTDLFFEIVEVGVRNNPSEVEKSMKHVLNSPSFERLWQARYNPEVKSVAELALMPKDSFGYALSLFLEKNNLDPAFYPSLEVRNKIEYLILRMRRIHDPMHVLTGFDSTVDGELGIQGFVVAQTQSLLSAIIISGGILHRVFFDPSNVLTSFKQIFKGFQMGLRANRLVDYRIEDFFELPLIEVQTNFGLSDDSFTHVKKSSGTDVVVIN